EIAPTQQDKHYITQILKIETIGQAQMDTTHIILETYHKVYTNPVDSIWYDDLYSGYNLKDTIHYSIKDNMDLEFKEAIKIPQFKIPFKTGTDVMSAFNLHN